MIRINFTEANGNQIEADAKEGETLMQVAVSAGVDAILAECGGSCICATCHCYIDPGWFDKLPPAGADEAEMLDCVLEPSDQSRLSCQITVTADMDGIVVNVPASQI